MNKHKAIIVCILIAYVLVVLGEILLLRKPFVGEHLQLEPFWSYKVIGVQYKQMLGNVIMFIPIGFLLSIIDKRVWLVLLISLSFSCLIEILQLLLETGLCELDDAFHNTMGALIGLLISKCIIKKYRNS